MYKKGLIFILLTTVSQFAYAAYSASVKITAVESQGADVSVYIDNGAVPDNPASCVNGSGNQLFLNNDEGLQRSYSAILTALATQSDVQLLLSSGACLYDRRVIIGVRVNRM